MIESIDDEYVNIFAYSPLIEITYIELPSGLKNSKKSLINIKNNDNKVFLWCHIRHLDFLEKNPQRITKKDREMINKLDYEGTKFPVSKKDYCKIERQSNIYIHVFCYESGLTYQIYLSNQKFKDRSDLLLISNENKSHSVYIKDFNRFVSNKIKNKKKHTFVNVVYNVLVVKKF